MTYEILKLTHLSMIFFVLLNLGGAAIHLMSGGSPQYRPRKVLAMLSGIALLIIAVTGFMLAKQIYVNETIHAWVYGKFIVWLYLGGVIALIHRKPQSAASLFVSVFVVATIGASLAIFKPW